MIPESGSIEASIAYIEYEPRFESEKPYICLLPNLVEFEPTNCRFSSKKQTTVRDLRPVKDKIAFEDAGFTVVWHRSSLLCDIGTLNGVKVSDELTNYLDETRLFAQHYFSADQAICFDWRVWPALKTNGK